MAIVIRGNPENLKRFFSAIPASISKSWHVEGVNMGVQNAYMFYYLGGDSAGINILEARKDSYNSYFVTAAGGNPFYGFLAGTAMSAFISDFKPWANACGVKIESN